MKLSIFRKKFNKRKLLVIITLILSLFFGNFRINSPKINSSLSNAERVIRGGSGQSGFNVIYRFKDHPRLVTEAVKFTNQSDLNQLIFELSNTNVNGRIEKIENLKTISAIEGENNIVVFFRKSDKNTFEIVGLTNSERKLKVIDLLQKFGYQNLI